MANASRDPRWSGNEPHSIERPGCLKQPGRFSERSREIRTPVCGGCSHQLVVALSLRDRWRERNQDAGYLLTLVRHRTLTPRRASCRGQGVSLLLAGG